MGSSSSSNIFQLEVSFQTGLRWVLDEGEMGLGGGVLWQAHRWKMKRKGSATDSPLPLISICTAHKTR